MISFKVLSIYLVLVFFLKIKTWVPPTERKVEEVEEIIILSYVILIVMPYSKYVIHSSNKGPERDRCLL